MKKAFFLSLVITFGSLSKAQTSDGLQLRYSFEMNSANPSLVNDVTGNDYNGVLANDASLKKLKDFNVLYLGNQNGYVDMGTKTGELIATLEDFTIAAYLYIEPLSSITDNGNFVWAFSTSNACTQNDGKYIAYRVNAQRYAQSTGGWGNEKVAIQKGAVAAKGVWQHVTYVQSGTTGTLYLDGTVLATGTGSYKPKDIGEATRYNWIGRPHFSSDVYLKGAWLSDFRIYNRGLSVAEITQLAANSGALNTAHAEQILQEAYDALTLENTDAVRSDLQLPANVLNQVTVAWKSSNTQYLTDAGAVIRPVYGNNPITVQLTATLTFNGATLQKIFQITIAPQLDDAASVVSDLDEITVHSGCYWVQTIPLPLKGVEGSTISWLSDDTEYLSHNGQIKKLSAKGEGNRNVKLTATVQKNNVSRSKDFTVCIKEDEGYSAYLFVYFTGNSGSEEAIRLAVSRDGYNYKALNGNQPIISSALISNKGGVRDPHILRGVDGSMFYMVATDMKSAEGWNSNHGIVLLKSTDLIHWTHSKIDIKAVYPEFNNIDRAWAPQTIYDPVARKYMIYWSMNSPTLGYDIIHYAYANDDFTALEGTPQVLFHHPQSKSCIDGDIIVKDGKYHLFFKTEGDGNGIKKAVSDHLTSGYMLQDKYLQQTTEAVEGSCVFRLINQEKYILMYDLYTSGKYQLTESSDLENFRALGADTKMDFTPRHGTVISITEEEKERLMQQWGQSLLTNSNPVLDGFYADPQVLYAKKTNKYYIYPTSDGYPGWGGYDFKAFSSDDLATWTNEGVILNLSTEQVSWANGNAWAPAIVEKIVDGNYKYFFYFSGNPVAGGGKQIGVAVADDPAGPFVDSGKPLIVNSPTGGGQQIDPCVLTDPVSGKSYIYWGNGYLAGAELNDDMISIKQGTTKILTPSGGSLSTYAYREGAYVFYRDGKYYFLWSVDDTGAANYHVAYGTATSPLGAITVAANPIVIIQDAANKIYGTGHNSVLQIPGKDEWYIIYHRINAAYLSNNPGYHREVCIDKMEFNADGTIKRVTPTHKGVRLNGGENAIPHVDAFSQKPAPYPNPANNMICLNISEKTSGNNTVSILSLTGETMKKKEFAPSDKIELNVSDMPKGVYIFSLQNSQTFYAYKFVKN